MNHIINYKAKNKNITEVPFHLLLAAHSKGTLAVEIEAKKLGLASQADWLVPACLDYLDKNVKLVRVGELYSPTETIKALVAENTALMPWHRGMLMYLTFSPRKEILGSLVQSKIPEYSGLVPLVLSIFKKNRKVQYSEWDWSDISMKYLVDQDLLDALVHPEVTLAKEKLIEIREYSMSFKTGGKAGTMRKPTETYSITTRTDDKEYNKLHRLRKIMDTQIWVAHPALRTNLMILDPRNLDSIPTPLVEEDFKETNYNSQEDIWKTT